MYLNVSRYWNSVTFFYFFFYTQTEKRFNIMPYDLRIEVMTASKRHDQRQTCENAIILSFTALWVNRWVPSLREVKGAKINHEKNWFRWSEIKWYMSQPYFEKWKNVQIEFLRINKKNPYLFYHLIFLACVPWIPPYLFTFCSRFNQIF